ncbi:hypothetical protein BST27_24460 [Mycobacterium intermedium]|uniref:Uncharacterized protein n=1 Tax=Mycobacterium intermedium TaxID=28445 RepID=A0A1E3S5W9_MYCIE|nr:hypothetical protein [Mycobacterium intermedium]MCV6965444.1 hypothetical protein [Mycobacterium intermedium]ODQ97539.1 hypothetical protein BHQ20_26255 [Mycobacterium intermedium]OPE46489.1 hypothetical protein BV508_25790 [Mycobacterium intermedium]ORA96707.1 hypothetical protein BST27_24460 [Mycobacterium intermedium]
MRITAIVATGLLAGTLIIASPAQAQPAAAASGVLSGLSPLRPPPSLSVDPKAEVEELLRQATALDDNWDNLSPAQRNQQIAALRQQAETVQREVDNLPPNEQPEVQGMLSLVALKLANVLRRQLASR